jgi:hypothetical protein
MSPHCPAIFLQHSRSAAVIAALGTTHAITGKPANNTARAKTATFCNSFNIISVAATVSWMQPEAKSGGVLICLVGLLIVGDRTDLLYQVEC